MNTTTRVHEYCSLFTEFSMYLREKKSYWLAPVIFVLLAMSALAFFLKAVFWLRLFIQCFSLWRACVWQQNSYPKVGPLVEVRNARTRVVPEQYRQNMEPIVRFSQEQHTIGSGRCRIVHRRQFGQLVLGFS